MMMRLFEANSGKLKSDCDRRIIKPIDVDLDIDRDKGSEPL